jgi:hypothetical protein
MIFILLGLRRAKYFIFAFFLPLDKKTNRGESQMKKVLLSLGLLVLLTGILTACTPSAKSDGTITLTILDINGDELDAKEVEFNEGDTFIEVLEKSELGFVFSESGLYGVSVLEIKGVGLGSTEWWSHTYNGPLSLTGVSTQPFEDGDVFVFQIMDWNTPS